MKNYITLHPVSNHTTTTATPATVVLPKDRYNKITKGRR